MKLTSRFSVVFCCSLCLAAGAATAAAAATGRPGRALLADLNAARVAHGLRPLRLDPTLTRAARAHTLDMLEHDYFAHGAFANRMEQFHVYGSREGEDLAWGSGAYARAQMILQTWLASPEHRANILDPRFVRVGIGVASGPFQGAAGATVFTADFASP